MKNLKEIIEKNGYTYKKVLIKNNEKRKVAIYRQDLDLPEGQKTVAFEVFIVKTTKAGEKRLPNGKIVRFEEAESFPSDESFGKHAWSYGTFDEAFDKMQELLA
jgi:hypothetical protein